MADTQLAGGGFVDGPGGPWCGRGNTPLWFQGGCVLTVISLLSCTSVWVVFPTGPFEPGAVGHGGVCKWPCVMWLALAVSECICQPHRLWVNKFMSILGEGSVGAASQVVPLPFVNRSFLIKARVSKDFHLTV